MTEKRFEIIKSAIIDGARVIKDNENKYTFATTFETATLINYRKALNELNDENEQLKQAYTQLKHRHSLLHDECIDAECDRDSYHKDIASLEKENEQLKKGMIGVVDRYIKNVECNPPSSARTYGKIKRALINIREDLRNLIGDLE